MGISVTELRLGNLIKLNDEIVQVDISIINYIDDCGDPENVSPIPLTEEWLKKFGFIQQGDRKVWILDRVAVTWTDHPDLRGKSTGDKFYLGFRDISGVIYRTTIEVLYVHVLQNALALTGKELEIK